MRTSVSRFLLAVAASHFLAGCVQGTLHERKASFYALSHGEAGLAPTKDFLTSRTAVLISGQHLAVSPSATNTEVFHFNAESPRFETGCATPVDRRGYFLTAAHAVGKEPPWLVFGPGNKLQAERAHVVWRGVVTNGEPDLALLWVPCPLGEVFEWASDFKAGDRVIGVGANQRPPSLDFQVVCFTGTLRESGSKSEAEGGRCAVFHTAPLHKGDSGGPLVALDGRLIGINVRCTKVFALLHPLGKRLNCAEHPSLSWLSELIEGHAGAQNRASAQRPNPAPETTAAAGQTR